MNDYLKTRFDTGTSTKPEEKEKRFPRMRDGKGKFYRNLKLDKSTMKLIHWYRGIKYRIDRNIKGDATKTD